MEYYPSKMYILSLNPKNTTYDNRNDYLTSDFVVYQHLKRIILDCQFGIILSFTRN